MRAMKATFSRPDKAVFGRKWDQMRIRSAITDLLQSKGGSVHRQAILEHLVSLGVMGDETSPMSSLAAYLTDMPDFVSHGAGHWALKSGPIPTRRRKPK